MCSKSRLGYPIINIIIVAAAAGVVVVLVDLHDLLLNCASRIMHCRHALTALKQSDEPFVLADLLVSIQEFPKFSFSDPGFGH